MGKIRTVRRPAYKSMVHGLEESQDKISRMNDKLEDENLALRKQNAHLRTIVKAFLSTDAGIDTLMTHVTFGQ